MEVIIDLLRVHLEHALLHWISTLRLAVVTVFVRIVIRV